MSIISSNLYIVDATAPFYQFPAEMVSHIFSHFSLPTLAICKRVCKLWKNLALLIIKDKIKLVEGLTLKDLAMSDPCYSIYCQPQFVKLLYTAGLIDNTPVDNHKNTFMHLLLKRYGNELERWGYFRV